MANSPILGLEDQNYQGVVPGGYPERVEIDRVANQNKTSIDRLVGQVTSSFSTNVNVSGNIADHIGQPLAAAFTRAPRIITQVVAFASTSGSGGVTELDVQISASNGGFISIFGNAAQRANISSSLGDYGLARSAVTGALWPANARMRVVAISAAGAAGVAASAQNNVTVEVFWKPSGSYLL